MRYNNLAPKVSHKWNMSLLRAVGVPMRNGQ
jgi:hypothetical protein